MKQIYHLITGIAMIMFVIACSSEDNMPNNSKIGFQRKGIDLVENHGIIEVPIVVEGVSKSLANPIKLSITNTDETAITDKDYKLIDHEITIHKNGIYGVKVEMIDNEELNENETPLTFKLNIVNSNNTCNVRNSECTCYIIDNEVKEKVIVLSDRVEGYYTFTGELPETAEQPAQMFSTEEGTVRITKGENENEFIISPITLVVSDDHVAPITKKELIATLTDEGDLLLKRFQMVGELIEGKGEAFIMFRTFGDNPSTPSKASFKKVNQHDFLLETNLLIATDYEPMIELENVSLRKVADLETN